jgi:hypothetical protein
MTVLTLPAVPGWIEPADSGQGLWISWHDRKFRQTGDAVW